MLDAGRFLGAWLLDSGAWLLDAALPDAALLESVQAYNAFMLFKLVIFNLLVFKPFKII